LIAGSAISAGAYSSHLSSPKASNKPLKGELPMTRRPNFWKCIMGVLVIALLFIGTMAITTAPRSKAQEKSQQQQQAGAPAAPGTPTPTPTPVVLPQSVKNVFEAFDGDAANDPAVTGEDWNDINPTANPSPGVANEDPPFGSALVRTFVYDPDIDSDFIFTGGGTKDFNDLNQWSNVQRGTGPDKDDVEHAYAAKYLDGITGHSVLVFGGDRPTSNGDANIGFWFFQKPVFVGPNGTFVDDTGALASHQVGDVFVLSAFTGGGGTSTIRVLRWISTAGQCTGAGTFIDSSSGGHLCDITGVATAVGSGATNKPICASPTNCPSQGNPDLGVPVVWPYQNKDNKIDCPGGGTLCKIPSPDFFEGAIDLSALNLQGECFSSFMLETRSAASVSAVLKDFALGKFESCSGTCNKTVDLGTVCEGTSSTFTYSTTNTGGTALGQTLKDDNATPADSTDDFYITGKDGAGACTTGSSAVTINVAAGATFSCTRTVTLAVGSHTDTLLVHTVSPFAGAVADCSKSATVTVVANPVANPASLELCETTPGGGTATFDLTTKNSVITGGAAGVTVSWFSDAALTTAIATPTAFTSGNAMVWAKVTNGNNCSSSTAVGLTVDPSPAANTASLELCETTVGGNTATFDLTSKNSTVTGGGGGSVSWFTNQALTLPIANPASFTSGSTTVYAKVTNTVTGCSNSAAVTLTVDKRPVVTINNFACDLDGSADLTATVTAGTGTAPFTYVWKKGGNTITPPDPNHPETITVTAPGTYTVDVTDSKTCAATQQSRTVGLCTSCSP
jgi:hypothetical protein